ncbi:hypothetical protein BURPS305_4449 [Burkholderia pseudomallei 305]|nr:hypothetical protein BURPS305_4449 [Burkholderia pseudomallei 305]
MPLHQSTCRDRADLNPLGAARRERPPARPPGPDNFPPIPANFRLAAAVPAAHADTLDGIAPSDFSGEHA